MPKDINELVSILTPCYNGEKYIWRLLDSILAQTYPNIEMFVIDDGSTDNSAKLIKSYIPKFEAKGYKLTYTYQENSGQSVAINNGLKLFSGDYLTWPDCDDWYAENDAIEQMVVCFENSDDTVSMVRCQSYLLEENTLKQIGLFCINEKNKGKTNLFEDCLFHTNGFWFSPICYMAKAIKIKELISNKEIYTEKHAGQNKQLMLPLFYKNKCITIEKYLFNILVRKNSHSNGQYSTFDQLLQRYDSSEKSTLNTINNILTMPVAEKMKYQQAFKMLCNEKRFMLFISYKKYFDAFRIFFELDCIYKKMILRKIIKRILKIIR